MEIKIGTRGSKLAIAQAESIRLMFEKQYPEHTFTLQVISTKGDVLQHKPLHEIGGSGLFTTEIERALKEREIRMAVHSMKDMPARISEDFLMVNAPVREDSRDVLILREKKSLSELPAGARIATGSIRRRKQLLLLRPDLKVVEIRGNVDTRLRKMEEEKLDGIVLAAAGLHRLSMADKITEYFSPSDMIPAPAQGALGLEILKADREMEEMLLSLCHNLEAGNTTDEILAERTFLMEIGADCHVPVGAYCRKSGEGYHLSVLYGRETEEKMFRAEVVRNNPIEAAKEAAKEIRGQLSGRVSLIGAGPGNPELITLLGKKRISNAQCILYDRLVSSELLSYAPADCEKIYVGKENKNHCMEQDEINALLLCMATKYERVVRLKGGDPYVFGRGGEEGKFLRKRGIMVEVVPGITSAVAGAAYAGIPVTHRGVAGGFHVVTAHDKQGNLSEIDFKAMAKSGETCIFLMGLSKLSEIAEGLLGAGMEQTTLAAVISHATTGRQKTCVAPLSEIADKVKKTGLTSPALIVVGAVVSLREELNFYESLPLFGKRCLVPEIGSGSHILTDSLKGLGAEVIRCKVGEIVYPENAIDFSKISDVGYLVFTSRHGVIGFFENLLRNHFDVRILAGIKIAAIGEKTAEVLKSYGIVADIVPELASGEALLGQVLAEQEQESGQKQGLSKTAQNGKKQILYLKGQLAEVAVDLKKYVKAVTVYRNEPVEFSCGAWEDYDYVFLTCGSSAERLVQEMGNDVPSSCRIVTIGPECTKRLRALGIMEWKQAKRPSIREMVDAVR